MTLDKIEVREIRNDPAELRILETINEEAIPEEERCALSDMFATGAKVRCIDVDREPAGFMAVRYYGDLVYLAYFAVRRDLRSKGIGGMAVRELIRQNPGRQIVAEYEAPDPQSADYAMRLRRKRFYFRNGFRETGWYTSYDNTEFEIGCAGKDFDPEEFMAFAEDIARVVSDHIPNPFQKGQTAHA